MSSSRLFGVVAPAAPDDGIRPGPIRWPRRPAGTYLDLTVRKIVALSDPFGRLTRVTSKDSTDTLLNEVAYTYDGWNNVSESEQDHAGTAGAGNPAVSYTYECGTFDGLRLKHTVLEAVKAARDRGSELGR